MSNEGHTLKGPSDRTISVFIIIDTVKLNELRKTNPTTYKPSQDQNEPTEIPMSAVNDLFFMVVTNARGAVTSQGSANPGFTAQAGDTVSFYGRAGDDNSDDAVIVYGIALYSGPNVFNKFITNVVKRSGAVFPNLSTDNGLPATPLPANFISLDARVAGTGDKTSVTERFWVYFALYELQGGSTQKLVGYYKWEPAITVKGQ